jgi:hypothetical protein
MAVIGTWWLCLLIKANQIKLSFVKRKIKPSPSVTSSKSFLENDKFKISWRNFLLKLYFVCIALQIFLKMYLGYYQQCIVGYAQSWWLYITLAYS